MAVSEMRTEMRHAVGKPIRGNPPTTRVAQSVLAYMHAIVRKEIMWLMNRMVTLILSATVCVWQSQSTICQEITPWMIFPRTIVLWAKRRL
jgi:hypothetical protein